jgi:hypothetical protein
MRASAGRTSDAEPEESFSHLLYRYLWPFQYFRDVTRGDLIERRQNYRYNRAMRTHLPAFMLKWCVVSTLCFLVGSAFDRADAVYLAAGCFVTWSWTFVVIVVLGVDWLWLERFPELH